MKIVLQLTAADGTKEFVTIDAGQNFHVPEGVKVEIVSLQGVNDLQVRGDQLVLTGQDGTIVIAGVADAAATATAGLMNPPVDGPLPDGFLHLLSWDSSSTQDDGHHGGGFPDSGGPTDTGVHNDVPPPSGNLERTVLAETVVTVAAPTISGFAEDTGLAGDGLTADASPTLTGTAEAGTTVTIYDGNVVLGSAVTDTNGNWFFAASQLAEGAHEFTAVASTSQAESNPSSALAVVIDISTPAAPQIESFSADTGTQGDAITSDSTLTLHGSAEAGATVTILDGADRIGTVTAAQDGSWTFTTAALADGQHSFTATAEDAAGNVGSASANFTVTVDTAAPGIPAISGFSTDTGVQGDHITSDANLVLSGTAEAGATVKLFDGAAAIGTATADANGAWTYETGALSAGAHDFTAVAIDAAGDQSAASAALSIAIDTEAPATPVIVGFAEDTGTAGDGITSDSTLAVTGTAEAGATVQLFRGETLLGSAIADSGGHWTVTTAPLADGNFALTAQASDAAGNLSGMSVALNVVVDTTPPDLPAITGFSADTGTVGDGVTSDSTITLSGTATGATSAVIYRDGVEIGTAAVNAGQWTFTTPELADGNHSFKVVAYDAAGNASSDSAPLVLTVDTTPPGAPTLTGFAEDSGAAGDSITNDNTITFSGTAGAGVTVNVYVGAEIVATAVADEHGNWSATSGTMSDGYYSFYAKAVDDAGNLSTAAGPLVVVVDTVAPSAPVIEGYQSDTGVAGDGITADRTVTLSGTAESGANSVLVFDGGMQIGTAAVSGGTWSFTTSSLPDGAHDFTVKAVDTAGNIGGASDVLTVTVDGTAPAAPVLSGFADDTGIPTDGQTSDNVLTFSGTGDAGTTVTVYDNHGTAVASAIVGIGGTWTATSGAIADGIYSFHAVASDEAGNTSAGSASFAVIIDTTPPPAPVISGFSDDTGIVGDAVTSDTTLALSGTAEANAKITVYDGAAVVGTTTADGAGAWTLTTGTLSAGDHNFTAVAADVAGNASNASGELTVTIDTTPPAAPVISGFGDNTGSTADSQTADNTITFAGTAEAGVTVNVYWGVDLVATAVADGNGNWSATSSALADGYYTFVARSADNVGNQSVASNALVVIVDTTPPTAPEISGFSADTGVAGDHLTSDATLTLTGTGENGTTIAVYDGSTLLGTATVLGGAWSFDTGSLGEGSHSFTATATDAAGNASAASASLDLTIDTTPPEAPVVAGFSQNTGSAGDASTSDNTPTFSGTATPGDTVNIYLGGTVVASGVADAHGNWTATANGLSDGYYSFIARSADAAGNLSTPSSPVIVVVDTTAPDAPAILGFSADTGVAGDGLTSDTTLHLSGTAEAGSTVTIYDGATVLGTAVSGDGTWTFDVSGLSEGGHNFTATATDAAGNTGNASAALSVTVDTTPPAVPTISGFSDDTGLAGDHITADKTLTLAGTADAGATVQIYWGATLVASGVADGNGHWSATTDALSDGYYSLQAKAMDAAGNQSGATAPLAVIVDTTAPVAPSITGFTDDSGVVGDHITSDTTLTLSGTAESSATVSIYDGATLLGTVTAAGGSWSFTTDVLANGEHSFTATATDGAGNASLSSEALSVTVDATPVEAPLISGFSSDTGIVGDGTTSDNTLTFSGTADAGMTVNVYSGATLVATGVADGNGNWTATSGVLADGYYSLTAQATNGATTSAASGPLIVSVDTTAPDAPGISSWSTDSGTAGDGITNNTVLTLTGSAAGATTVAVYDGATFLGTAAVGSGSWSFTTSTLAEGDHSFTVVAEDSAGNASTTSSALDVTIDLTPPAAPTLTGQPTYVADNTPTFSGTAEAGAAINVYANGTVIATGIADANGNWNATPSTALGEGYQSVTARAVDSAGNLSLNSATTSFFVDTVAPAAPVILGYSNDSGAAGDGITNDTTLTLNGSVTAGTASVKVYDGTTFLGTATVSGTSWTFTTAALSEGGHSLTAIASDYAGNASSSSSALSVTIDVTAPAAPTLASLGTYVADSTPTFSGTAEAGTTVNVYSNGSIIATGIADDHGNWTATPASALADGYQSITARAADAAGNLSVNSGPAIFFIDTVAPNAPVISGYSTDSGTAGDGITNDTTLTLNGTVTAGVASVKVYDGATFLGVATVNGTSWSYTTSALAQGSHALTAVAADYAGNASTASAELSVSIDTTAPGKPTIDSVGAYSNDNTPTFSGTAEAGTTVNVYLSGAVIASAVADGSGHWSATAASAVPDGYSSFTARAFDLAGNGSAVSDPSIRIIDTVAPNAPSISSFSPDTGTAGDGVTTSNMLTLSGTAPSDASSVAVYDGATLLGTTSVSSGSWSFGTSLLSDGTHSFTVVAMDYAGNASAASSALSVTVDATAPAAPVIASFADDTGAVGDGQTTDTTLVLSGTAEASARITVYDGTTVLGTATAGTDGSWNFTTADLALGAHSFTAMATDAVGLNSTASSVLNVVIVAAGPATPDAPVIDGFSTDTGTQGDSVTSDNTPTFSGTAAAGATVGLYSGTTLIGTAVADGSGHWSATTSALSDGGYTIVARASNSSGQSPDSSAVSIMVDTVAPATPTVSSLGTYVTDNTPTFTGTAEVGATVNVYAGGSLVASGVADANGNWSATPSSALAEGYQSVTVRAVDVAGNSSGTSGSIAFFVDTIAPAAPAISSYSPDSGTVGDGVTNGTALTLTGTAELGVASVKIYDGATLLGTATVGGTSWSFTTSTLSQGAHALTAVATDYAGNASAASSALNVTVDTTAPATPSLVTLSTYVADNTPTFSGTAEAGATVNVYVNSSVVATGVADANGNWSATSSVALGEGYQSAFARAADSAGNLSGASSPIAFFVDTVAPAAPAISSYSPDTGTAGDGISSSTSLSISGTTVSGTASVKVYDGATYLGLATVNGTSWSFTTSTLAQGAHSFTAVASDYAGNASSASSALAVTVDTTAPSAPSIASVGTYVADSTPTFTGTAEAGVTVNVYSGASIIATAIADGSGHWSATPAIALADGYQNVMARAVDAAGNLSTASSSMAFFIDTVPPASPSISSFANDSGTTGDGITNDTTVTLNGSAAAGTASVKVYDGATFLGNAVVSGTSWTFTTAALAQGAHSFTAVANDYAGNASNASGAFGVTIDTTPPAAPVIATSGGITSDSTPTFDGTAEAGSLVKVVLAGSVIASAVADETGHWSATPTVALADGYYSFTANAYDQAGNASVGSNQTIFLIDATPPAAPVISGIDDSSGTLSVDYTKETAVTLHGTATDATMVQIYDGATLLGSAVVSGGSWSYTTSSLSSGEHEFSATASDSAGNISSSSSQTTLTLGAYVQSGTTGDDSFTTSGPIGSIQGLAGTDTLHFNGSSLSSVDLAHVSSIERIDLNQGSAQTLSLTASDVLNISGDVFGTPGSETTRLIVLGDSADNVTVTDSGWTSAGSEVVNGVTFNVFDHGQAQLLVQTDVTTHGLPIA